MPETALRIALLTHSTHPRGGVVHTLQLGRALQAMGHAVTIMVPSPGRKRLFRETPCDLDVFDVAEGAGTFVHLIRARIEAYIHHLSETRDSRPRYANFDVMHAQDGIGGNALTTLAEAGLIPGFVRTVHHIDHHAEELVNSWEERAICGARRVCCVSSHWQDALRRRYGVQSLVVNNGVDLSRYTPNVQPADSDVAERFGLKPDAPLIVSIGGVEERKNTLQTLHAFLLLRQRLPHAQWVIVGGASLLDHSCYRATFDAVVRASGLVDARGGDIVHTGVVADADICALLRLARAVAFPSLREGFGLVVLEALASGTPTVVSRIAPFTEYLNADDVHWADPYDAASISAALAAAVATAKFQPPAICKRFSWEASAACHVGVYRDYLRDESSTLQ